METKQTAVEWLMSQYRIDPDYPITTLTISSKSIDIWNQALKIEKEQIGLQQLEAAFKAGWMRANATNYDDSYFQHFLSENYDNH